MARRCASSIPRGAAPAFIYLTLVSLHVLAATIWVGGVLFLALVGAPVLRGVEPAELRARLFEGVGLRFRWVGWVAVGVLLLTGALLLVHRGWWPALLESPAFRASPVGGLLLWKLALVAVMVVSSAVHDLAFAPSRAPERGASPGDVARRWWVYLARGAALLAVVVVVLAVQIVRR